MRGFALERSRFSPFVLRDGGGKVHFSGRHRSSARRHRERIWPALSRYKKTRRKTDAWWQRSCPVPTVKLNRSIEKAALLTVLRRWDPICALDAWHLKQCDHAQRPPRYDPW
jgi:hypothetical protein